MSLGTKLLRIPASGWALVYAIIVLVFALVYYALPGYSFRHSVPEHEVSLLREGYALTDSLHAAILRTVAGNTGSHVVSHGDWEMDWRRCSVDNVTPGGDDVLSLGTTLVAVQSGGWPKKKQYAVLRLTAPSGWVESSLGVRKGVLVEPAESAWSFPIPQNRIVPGKPPPELPPDHSGISARMDVRGVTNFPPGYDDFELLIPAALQHRLTEFRYASSGYPTVGKGGFPRMLYFSIVTITTLGYGDIVPMSNRARGAVAAESLSGIAVMGLFINAVVRRKQASHTPVPLAKREDRMTPN